MTDGDGDGEIDNGLEGREEVLVCSEEVRSNKRGDWMDENVGMNPKQIKEMNQQAHLSLTNPTFIYLNST